MSVKDDKTSLAVKGTVEVPNVEGSNDLLSGEISGVEIKSRGSVDNESKGTCGVPNVAADKSQLEEVQVSSFAGTATIHSDKMSKVLEPPAFVGKNKPYAEYKVDLQRWSRI